MRKKAQSQIISTVLIILLVLAAIVIVWQVVNSTLTRGTGEINQASNCLGVNVVITNAPVGGPITAQREAGGPNIGGQLIFYKNGANIGAGTKTNVKELDTDNFADTTLAAGNRVQAGMAFNIGQPTEFKCPMGSEVVVPYP